MFKNIDRYLTVSASSIYAADGGIPLEAPSAIDAQVTLPAIGHPTTTVNMMGSYDVADEARVDNLQITISCQSTEEALELLKHNEFIIKYAMQKEDKETGLSSYVGFTAFATGKPSTFGGGSIAVGEAGEGDITINCLKYRLIQGEKELIYIDRLAGKLVINGVDKRSELNKLL